MAEMARSSVLDLRSLTATPRLLWRAGLAALAASAALAPSAARACELTDPGCYIDDFAHQQIRELALSIWQLNRAGLVLARWVEDLRAWLTETVLVDAFNQLAGPVHWTFLLALIIAWMIFVISFMVQALVDLRWVDLRRASGPIVLALLVFAKGGELMQQCEHIRLLGSGMLQGIAQSVVPEDAPENSRKRVPAISMVRSGDLPDQLKPLYKEESSCGTKARVVSALALNDYDAYYLLANAGDIHCAEALQLATDFRTAFFGSASIADMGGWQRREALSLAAQGGLRQVTGLFLTAGALIEQLMHLLFALALALVWFGLLLSLVFAVFLPSEALFTQQLRALLAVMRASWLASFLLGLGLAILKQVAASGNGFVLLIGGLVLIVVCLWQCRQALAVLHSAAASAGAAMAGAPQAVGGMLRSWATTGALVAGVAATGGMGPAVTQIGAAMARRMGRQAGDNPLARAAGRVLSRRVASRLDALTADQQIAHEADLSQAEAAWYERLPADAAPADAPARASAARAHSRGQQARLLERRAARARQQRNFALADQLRRTAAALRPAPPEARLSPGQDAAPAEPRAKQPAPVSPARQLRKAQVAHVRAAARRIQRSEHPPARAQTARKAGLRVARRASIIAVDGSQEPLLDLPDMTVDLIASPAEANGSLSQKPAERPRPGAPQAPAASAERPAFRANMRTMLNQPTALAPAQALQTTAGARADVSAVPELPGAAQSDVTGIAGAAQAVRAIEVARTAPAAPAAPPGGANGPGQNQAGYWGQQRRADRASMTNSHPPTPNPSAESAPARSEPAPAPAPHTAATSATLPTAAQPAATPTAPARDSAAPQPTAAEPAGAPTATPDRPRGIPATQLASAHASAVAGAPDIPATRVAPAAHPARVPSAAEPPTKRPPAAQPSAPQQPWKRKRGGA